MEIKENRRKGYRLTIPEKEEVKNYIAELYAKGYSYTAMTKWITEQGGIAISRSSLIPYVKEVLKEWHDSRIENIEMRMVIEMAKLDKVESEAWDAWERSKEDYYKKRIKRKGVPVPDSSSDNNSSDSNIPRIKTVEVTEYEETETSCGDPRFAEIILKCIDARMSLIAKDFFSRDKPQEYINNTNNGVQLVITTAPRLSPKMEALRAKEKEEQEKANRLNRE